MFPEYPTYETWREIAFSHRQIQEFLSIIALPHYEAGKVLPPGSSLRRCFCTGFYFFCRSIQAELAPALAEALLNLAVRVEYSCTASVWDQNAEAARHLLADYFNEGQSTGA